MAEQSRQLKLIEEPDPIDAAAEDAFYLVQRLEKVVAKVGVVRLFVACLFVCLLACFLLQSAQLLS